MTASRASGSNVSQLPRRSLTGIVGVSALLAVFSHPTNASRSPASGNLDETSTSDRVITPIIRGVHGELADVDPIGGDVTPIVGRERGQLRTDMRGRALGIAPIIAFLVLMLGAALIRLTGIAFGSPFGYHPDEWAVLQPAMNMIHDRDWAPHVYYYPSGLIDVQAVVVGALRLVGGPTVETGQGWLMPWEFLPVQFRYVLAGRLLVMTMGVATVAVVFWIGCRLAGYGAGLAAAALLAVMPLHVEHSRYLTTDVPVALACSLTLAVTLVASRRQGTRWWILAGAFAGIAGGIKWNGLAVLVVPVIGYLVSASSVRDVFTRRKLATLVFIGVAAVVTLLLTTPAIVFDSAAVADYLRLQATGYAVSHFNRPDNGLIANVNALVNGLGPIGLAAAGSGLVAMTVRPTTRVEWVIPFFSALYLIVASLPALHYARNLLPILPYLAIAAGVCAARVAGWLTFRLGGEGTGDPTGRQWLAAAPIIVVLAVALAAASSAEPDPDWPSHDG